MWATHQKSWHFSWVFQSRLSLPTNRCWYWKRRTYTEQRCICWLWTWTKRTCSCSWNPIPWWWLHFRYLAGIKSIIYYSLTWPCKILSITSYHVRIYFPFGFVEWGPPGQCCAVANLLFEESDHFLIFACFFRFYYPYMQFSLVFGTVSTYIILYICI